MGVQRGGSASIDLAAMRPPLFFVLTLFPVFRSLVYIFPPQYLTRVVLLCVNAICVRHVSLTHCVLPCVAVRERARTFATYRISLFTVLTICCL